MAQSQNQPLYWDKDRVPVNLTLILSLGIVIWGIGGVLGLIPFGGNPQLIVILGIAVAAYTWLFTPRSYGVYADCLVIHYGRPRIKVMRFSDIDTVELGSMAALDRLRVRPLRGRRQSIRVRDVDAFYENLESALNAFRNAHPEYGEPLPPLPTNPASAAAPATAAAEPESATATADPEPPTDSADAAAAGPPAADPGAESGAESRDDNPPPEHRPIY